MSYREGPIKDLIRSKAKTENDYFKEPFPSSNKVIDFVRGSLVFDKAQDCVDALQTVEKAVMSGKTCIKTIGRIKNM